MTEQQSAFSEAKESHFRLVRSVARDLNIFRAKPFLPMLPGSPGLESGGTLKLVHRAQSRAVL
jgi:hypothetical protein